MGNPLTGRAVPRSMPPRFSTGRINGGLAACAWLWCATGALTSAPVMDPSASATLHQRVANLGDARSPELPTVAHMPPADPGLNVFPDANAGPVRNASPVAGVLARRRAHPSPSPSATPEDSPSASGDGSSPSPSPGDDAAASPSPSAMPSGTPSSAFLQKLEAATVAFIQKDYDEAKKLLDEADAIQPHQPKSAELRNQIFKQYYEASYAAYQHGDYPGALTQLDGADSVGSNSQNQSDAYNLRGLVLSKQRNYEGAENMFRKAVQTDPGLWAAKFNYAEVPFNYRNYTVARSRFEELFSQTDPAKQPVEAELTQFKVFLTLLLEGKEDAARTFMQHFNFSGATPARYFCQAALNFYSGDVDKAQGWIDSARKEYPPRKSSSFLEAFYRVGWLSDPSVSPSGTPAPALAAASPSATPALTATPAVVAVATPTPAPAKPMPSATMASTPVVAVSTPAFHTAVQLPTAMPSATPAVAMSTPAPTTAKAPVLAVNTPIPVPSKAPVVSLITPIPAPTAPKAPAVVLSSPSPTASKAPVVVAALMPTPTKAPVIAAATPVLTPTKAPVLAVATPSVHATASVTPRSVVQATPAVRTAPASPPPTALPVAKAPVVAAQPESDGGDFWRILVVGAVALYFLYVVARILWTAINRKPRRRTASGNPPIGSQEKAEVDKVETPR